MNLDLAELVGLVSGDAAAALAGVTNLIDVGGEAVMQVEAGARFDLDFGLDLSDGVDPVPFLYDTTGLDPRCRHPRVGHPLPSRRGPGRRLHRQRYRGGYRHARPRRKSEHRGPGGIHGQPPSRTRRITATG